MTNLFYRMRAGYKKLWAILGATTITLFFLQFSFDDNFFKEPGASFSESLPPFLTDTASWPDSLYNQLSLEAKIGQMMMVAAYPNKGEQDKKRVSELITKHNVGGIIFFQGNTQQVAELTAYYQSISKVPLLIAIDGEWGLAMRLSDGIQYPKEMTLGAITDEMLIYEMGHDIAKQLKHIGIHVNFAPVVDINNNALNPVINSRSFGELRANVARKGILYMKGMQDEGVLAFAKHFPGHGDTQTDSHKGLPVINHSPDRLDSLELYPFRALINAGVAGVMIAHMNVLSLDTTKALPSTLSPIIVDTLLQKKMGFRGLVVTDALEMKGLADYFAPVEANIRAINAGNDILLMPGDVENTIPAIVKAIEAGEIDKNKIEQSCRKIIHAKEWAINKSVNEKYTIDSLNKPEYLLNRQKLIEASLTVIKNDKNLLPLRRLDTLKIAHVKVGNSSGDEFLGMLRLYARVDAFNTPKEPDSSHIKILLDTLKNYNLVITSLHSNSIFASRNFDVGYKQKILLDTLIASGNSVLAAFVNPYALSDLRYLNKSQSVIVAYENDAVTQRSAAHLLFGAIAAEGRLPVSINNSFRAGTGHQTQILDRFKYVEPFEAGFDYKKLLKVDSIIQNAIDEKAMPGCQVIASKNGKVFLNKSYGFHDFSEKTPVMPTDLYDIASLTKITATLPIIMQLDGTGTINLNDKLGKFFPYLDTCDKGNLVLSDILMHQSGLAAWIPFYWSVLEPVYPNQNLTSSKLNEDYPIQVAARTFANKHLKYKDLYFSTSFSEDYPLQVANNLFLRKDYADSIWTKIISSKIEKTGQYKYSDLGFYILQKIIEQQTGQKLDKLADSALFNRLGAYTLCFNPLKVFDKSCIVPTENDLVFRRQIIHGYVHDPGAAMLGGVSGHAGLFGCANDVAKIMQMYLNGGHFGGVEYIENKTISKYTSNGSNTNGNRRGLGFDKPEPDTALSGPAFKGISAKSYGHTGFTGTMAWADPETGIVYVFLSNRIYPDALNTKLAKMDVRTNIQKAIYDSMKK
ncbi:MAG: serine hydrolase [Bacteroidales bacterium]|nr:serine hydrolase [Bacteroidales bacterium]